MKPRESSAGAICIIDSPNDVSYVEVNGDPNDWMFVETGEAFLVLEDVSPNESGWCRTIVFSHDSGFSVMNFLPASKRRWIRGVQHEK